MMSRISIFPTTRKVQWDEIWWWESYGNQYFRLFEIKMKNVFEVIGQIRPASADTSPLMCAVVRVSPWANGELC